METIIQVITNLGFPIACCIGLAKYVKYITDKHEKETDQLRNSYEKQTHELKESFDRNTNVLTELVIYLKEVIKRE